MEFREKKRWGFFGLPFTFTTYMVTEELITVEEGFINKRENDCYIYKVQDVELIRTLGAVSYTHLTLPTILRV